MVRVFRWFFRFALAGVLAVVLGYLPYRTYGPGGIGRVLELDRDYNKMMRRNNEIASNNRVLLQQIRRLKTSRAAIERVARDELGLVRPNDLVFQFE